jgi:hypothetical protein
MSSTIEAQRDYYYFKPACCNSFHNIYCHCDSICYDRIHCKILTVYKRALPGGKYDYLNIKPIDHTMNWTHSVPSLLRLSYGATRYYKKAVPTYLQTGVKYLLNENEKKRKLIIHGNDWSKRLRRA